MKKQRGILVQMIVILVLGVVVSIITGSFEVNGQNIYWEDLDLEIIMKYLNIGLIIVALVLGVSAAYMLSLRGKPGGKDQLIQNEPGDNQKLEDIDH